MSTADLAGRRALVTGGDSDIGRAIAVGLAARGAEVIVHHHGQADAAAETARLIAGTGATGHVVSGDFAAPGAASDVVAEAQTRWGAIDILIANAAIERRGPWLELDESTMTEHFQVNFVASIGLMQATIPGMRERGWGRIVCLGSIMARRPRAETVAYAALKSAQLTAVRAIGREVARSGVTVNVVSPGAIETSRNAARYADPSFRASVIAKIPAGRPGTPDDVVPPVLMLCSEEASYITGADIIVDGGWSIGDAPA